MKRTIVTVWFWVLCVVGAAAQDSIAVATTTQDSVVLAAVARSGAGVDSMQYLQNVIVYGRKPYDEVIPAQMLTGKQLEGLNSQSVADAVRYFSGVQLKDYGGVGGLKTIDIRSMGTNQMGVFYDGIQIVNAQNGQVDLGRFSLDNIEAVALYNGQKSNIFQSAHDFGTAGSLYMQTKRPHFSAGRRNNFNVTFRTGSFGLVNPSLRWEHKLNRHVSLSFNAEYTYATGQYHFRYHKVFSDGTLAWDTTAVRKNGDVHALRLEAGAYGVFSRGRWDAKLYYYDSEKGIPGAIVNNVWKMSQRQWDRNFFMQGTYTQRVTDRYEVKANAKYGRDYLHYLNPDTTSLYIDNEFWQDEIYLSVANKYTLLTGWDVDLSVDYQWNTLDATLRDFVEPVRHSLLAALATAYSWHRLKGQASLLMSYYHDYSEPRSGDYVIAHRRKDTHKFTPAIYLSYQPWEQHDLNLRAFFKRVFRMPTFNDLYYTDIGNIALRPEYATQYNLGAQYQVLTGHGMLAGLKCSADVYYNTITDKIVAIPKGSGQYRWMMMNLGEVRIRGIDVSARATMRLPAHVTGDVNLSYTYQKAQDYSDPSDTRDGGTYRGQIAYIPWHSGSAVAHVNWRALDVNYSFIYCGERYHTSSNIPANHEQPWYTHDLSASYSFALGSHATLRLTAEVNNLFNQQYDVILNYPMPGRNYKLIMKFDL